MEGLYGCLGNGRNEIRFIIKREVRVVVKERDGGRFSNGEVDRSCARKKMIIGTIFYIDNYRGSRTVMVI